MRRCDCLLLLQTTEGNAPFEFTPSAIVTGLYPNNGLESGQPVFVLGRNFRNASSTLMCRFGSFTTIATFVSDKILMCMSPPQPPGSVEVEITIDSTTWSKQRILFYYRKCSEGSYCSNGEEEEVLRPF